MSTPELTPEPIAEPRTCRSPRGRRVGVVLAAIALVLATGLWWWRQPPRPAAPRLLLPIVEDGKWGMIDADTGALVIPPTWLGITVPARNLRNTWVSVDMRDFEWIGMPPLRAESLYDWHERAIRRGAGDHLEPVSVVFGELNDSHWRRGAAFPYIERAIIRSVTALTADNRVIDRARFGERCGISRHWLVMADQKGRRRLLSQADLRPTSVPAGVNLGALGETLWRVDPAAGEATMTEPNDSWTVPFPPPLPPVEREKRDVNWLSSNAMLFHWRFSWPPQTKQPGAASASAGQADLVVAGYRGGRTIHLEAEGFAENHALADEMRGCTGLSYAGDYSYVICDAIVTWRRDGRTSTEPERYQAVWPGLPAADGLPTWFGLRQGWLVRLTPDGPQPLAEIGPALQVVPGRIYRVDQWSATGLFFTKSTRHSLRGDTIADHTETVVVVGQRMVKIPRNLAVRRHLEWEGRLYLQCDQGLYEVLASGEARIVGTPLTEDQRLLSVRVQGDRLSLVLAQGTSIHDGPHVRYPPYRGQIQRLWLAEYDRDGTLLSTREHPIPGNFTLDFDFGDVYVLWDPVGVLRDPEQLELLDQQLQSYLPDGVVCRRVLVRGSTAEGPGDWVLWLQRGDDHYLGDLHGARLFDIPDTELREVRVVKGSPPQWKVVRESGTDILDEYGAPIATLPGVFGVDERFDTYWSHRDDAGYHLVDAQGREQLDRPFAKMLQVTEQILLVESADEARYLRLSDLKELWRSKPGYAVTFRADDWIF